MVPSFDVPSRAGRDCPTVSRRPTSSPWPAEARRRVGAAGRPVPWRTDWWNPAPPTRAPLDALRGALPGAPELVSGAGHDAGIIAAAGVPTAMLFVRSLNGGVSHSPDELSSEEDIAIAVDALCAALVRIAS